MSRWKKCCAYRDCSVSCQTHPELTLFQFPKNEDRVAKWCELGVVNTSEPQPWYMCELHFSRIYMCFSARRKMLLSTAVPRAYGTTGEDNQEDGQNSSAPECEEITLEEHLDENMEDENGDLATEIIYMDPKTLDEEPMEAADQLITPLPSKNQPTEEDVPPYTKIVKVEKISPISHSMIVSSSSSSSKASALVDDTLKRITPPKNIILRRVKLKKRPSAPKTTSIMSTQPSAVTQSTTIGATTIEPTVSSSPERKVPRNSDIQMSNEELPKEASSSKTETEKVVASSCSTTANESEKSSKSAIEDRKKPVSSSPAKKEELIYEFIFKGEEYVQLPKAKYYGELNELQNRLDQCEQEKQDMRKKVQYYRQAVKDLRDFLNNIEDDD